MLYILCVVLKQTFSSLPKAKWNLFRKKVRDELKILYFKTTQEYLATCINAGFARYFTLLNCQKQDYNLKNLKCQVIYKFCNFFQLLGNPIIPRIFLIEIDFKCKESSFKISSEVWQLNIRKTTCRLHKTCFFCVNFFVLLHSII